MTDLEQVRDRTGERIRAALMDGGRAEVTVRSRRTGEHVTVVLAVRKRRAGGGFVSRAKLEGRVGWADGDRVTAYDPGREFPNSLGSFVKGADRWFTDRGADRARAWAAEAAVNFALGRADLDAQADVFLSSKCSHCGRRLTDPESVERGVGPECFGRSTGSRSAAREVVVA